MNFKLVKLGDFIKQIRGVSYKKSDIYTNLNEKSIELLRANNIKDSNLVLDDIVYVDKSKVKKEQILKKGDILICASSGSKHLVGKSVLIKENTNFTFGAFCKVIRTEKISSRFLEYFFQSQEYRNLINQVVSGTNINNIKNEHIDNIMIPLPPINEQQRIVNRIESLFTKLDRAKELIEKTLAQFEQNKMAILHKAFTGELTAKWRKENNINEKNFFNKVKLKNVIKLISGRDVSVSLCNDKSIGIPYILGASNIKDNKFFIERWIENPVVVSEKNDILLSVKGTIGKLYLQKEEKINISRQIMALRALNELNTHYLYYFLLRECERLKFEGNGLIPGISRKDILDLNILLPTLEEQQEIVNILDNLLAKYNKIKNLEQQLEKIELLKKAILAKAFRGELGTNNPDEESAENLLKEILAEK